MWERSTRIEDGRGSGIKQKVRQQFSMERRGFGVTLPWEQLALSVYLTDSSHTHTHTHTHTPTHTHTHTHTHKHSSSLEDGQVTQPVVTHRRCDVSVSEESSPHSASNTWLLYQLETWWKNINKYDWHHNPTDSICLWFFPLTSY